MWWLVIVACVVSFASGWACCVWNANRRRGPDDQVTIAGHHKPREVEGFKVYKERPGTSPTRGLVRVRRARIIPGNRTGTAYRTED